MIVVAEKKINRISLCCKTIEIQISSFAGFASIRQTPTELPRQAGEWRMLFEVLPSTLSVNVHPCRPDIDTPLKIMDRLVFAHRVHADATYAKESFR